MLSRKGLFVGFVAFALVCTRLIQAQQLEDLARQIDDRVGNYIASSNDPELVERAFPESQAWYDLESYRSALAVAPETQVSVHLQEAISDVRFFFALLRAAYPAYEYFGGDRPFAQAESSVLEALESVSGVVRPNVLGSELRRSLSFVRDNHFLIDGRNIDFDPVYLLSDTRDDWFSDQNGFYRVRDQQKQYLVSVEGSDPADSLRLSVAADGRLCYRLTREHHRQNVMIDVEVQVGSQTKMERRYLYHGPAYDPHSVYDKLIADGVTVHSLGSMRGLDDERMMRFVDEGPQAGDEEAAILDLRGNAGGFTDGIAAWFERFAGSPRRRNGTYAFLQSLTIGDLRDLQRDDTTSVRLAGTRAWSELYSDDVSPLATPILFVLIDERGASATEDLVEWLHPARTVVFVGESTAGVLLVGGNTAVRLPNSGIPIQFGSNLTVSPTTEEGAGFQADLVLPATPRVDMIERVLAFIEHYQADSIRDKLLKQR